MLRFLIFLFVIVTLSARAQNGLTRYRYSKPAMGTTFMLTFYASDRQQADNAAELAFSRVEELNEVFSDYLEHSEASRLSRSAGQKVKVSDEMWYLLKLSKEISRASKGAFDVTIGPLTKLWRRAIRQQQLPDSSRITEALKLVNYKWIKLFPGSQQVKLKKSGMRLDFGGIAKGYTIDQAFRALNSENIEIALVDGGGDLYVSSTPPDGTSWVIKDTEGNALPITPPAGIASSGDQFQFLSWNGKRFSHIINPADGLGIQDSQTITVIAANAVIADALASTFSILTGKHRIKMLRKYQAVLVE